jgi:hypothetical protein
VASDRVEHARGLSSGDQGRGAGDDLIEHDLIVEAGTV